MLIERWERFRGVDHWPEVIAVMTDETSWLLLARPGAIKLLTSIRVNYTAADGVLRSKAIRYWLSGCSLDVGEEFYIRCSPGDPSKIYVRESAQDKFLGAAGASIVALSVWLLERYR
jgi:hypothetical protein